MIYDKLLEKIDAYHKTCLSGGSDKDVPKSYNWSCYNLHAMARALRAVVELHPMIEQGEPFTDGDRYGVTIYMCDKCNVPYPCKDIQVIEKELG